MKIINSILESIGSTADTSLRILNEVYFGKQLELREIEKIIDKLRSHADQNGDIPDGALNKALDSIGALIKSLFGFNKVSWQLDDTGATPFATALDDSLIKAEFEVISAPDYSNQENHYIKKYKNPDKVLNIGFYDNENKTYHDPHQIDFLIVTEDGIKINRDRIAVNIEFILQKKILTTSALFLTSSAFVAALLHEIGHNFQSYFFANSTSKVKFPLYKSMNSLEQYHKTEPSIGKKLLRSTSKAKRNAIINNSVYDTDYLPSLSEEYFADQFVAMYGYGSEYVSSLINVHKYLIDQLKQSDPSINIDQSDIVSVNKTLHKRVRPEYISTNLNRATMMLDSNIKRLQQLATNDENPYLQQLHQQTLPILINNKKFLKSNKNLSTITSPGEHPVELARIDAVIDQMKTDLKDKLLGSEKKRKLKQDLKKATDIRRTFRSNKDRDPVVAYYKQLSKNYKHQKIDKQAKTATDPKVINRFLNDFRQ